MLHSFDQTAKIQLPSVIGTTFPLTAASTSFQWAQKLENALHSTLSSHINRRIIQSWASYQIGTTVSKIGNGMIDLAGPINLNFQKLEFSKIEIFQNGIFFELLPINLSLAIACLVRNKVNLQF